MNYIVFDLEWNQGETHDKIPGAPTFEIIEIGAVKLNEAFEIVDEYQSLIRPQIYATMHKVTEELVNLNMEDLASARTFCEVAKEFLAWSGKNAIFCIWGVQDLTELQKNMDYYQMEPLSKGPVKYYDIQKLYSLACDDGKVRSSLSHVVEAEQMLEEKVPFHRAFSDAYYTARIFQKIRNEALLKRVSFDTYRVPADRREQIFWRFDNYTKFISQGYEEKSEMLSNKNIACIRCVYCQNALRKKIPWFTANNGKHYYSVARCDVHGMMKGKIRVRKNKQDMYFAIKTIRHITEEEADEIVAKYKSK